MVSASPVDSDQSAPKSDNMSGQSSDVDVPSREVKCEAGLNRSMAVIMPLIEAGAVGYGTYVLVILICIEYLLHPDAELQAAGIHPRTGTAIALLVIYFILLAIMALTFLRLIQVIWVNPGYVPFANPDPEKGVTSTRDFDRLDAYICDYQGAPLWCSKCNNWKPDRTHHSSALGRCVRRMDHFCPYAGGIISETSHKFFVQFLFYGSLYTGFTMTVIAIFFAERSKKLGSKPGSWIAGLALSAVFFAFALGMFITTLSNLCSNLTTVELENKHQTHNIALLGAIPSPSHRHPDILHIAQRTPSRSYLVVQTQPGENPWRLEVLSNIKQVMGNSVVDWFLPFKMSPCTVHNNPAGEFPWGEVVTKLMVTHEAGSAYGAARSRSSRSRRSRGSRSEGHSHRHSRRGSRSSPSRP